MTEDAQVSIAYALLSAIMRSFPESIEMEGTGEDRKATFVYPDGVRLTVKVTEISLEGREGHIEMDFSDIRVVIPSRWQPTMIRRIVPDDRITHRHDPRQAKPL